MDKFERLDGLVAPLDRNNVDTDAIIPKQFLKSIKRSGFGPNAFDEWRYMDVGQPGQDCSQRPLNPDFFKNGILPIVLPVAESEALFQQVVATPGYKLVIDLRAQQVVRPDSHAIPFAIDAFRKECLLNGWDDIGLTLRHADAIREFESKRRIEQPWLFA